MYLRHPLLSSYGIEHGFGLALSKDPASRPLTARQVHGVDVRRVDENRDAAFEADGLWTEAPGTRIGIWTADCLPVLFADKGGAGCERRSRRMAGCGKGNCHRSS